MKTITITNNQKNAEWAEGTCEVPETFEEILDRYQTERGAMKLMLHSLPIFARRCKNVENLQAYVDQILRNEIDRSHSVKEDLVEALSGHLDREILRGMTVKALRALAEALL